MHKLTVFGTDGGYPVRPVGEIESRVERAAAASGCPGDYRAIRCNVCRPNHDRVAVALSKARAQLRIG